MHNTIATFRMVLKTEVPIIKHSGDVSSQMNFGFHFMSNFLIFFFFFKMLLDNNNNLSFCMIVTILTAAGSEVCWLCDHLCVIIVL